MYEVRYHPHAVKDLKKLDRATQKRALKAVEGKLMIAPLHFGKPLNSPLAPFRSLRLGDHRLVYVVEGKQVFVLAVGHRRDIYDIANERS